LPEEAKPFVSDELLSWLIKPQWAPRIEAIFDHLPREIRKELIPLSDSASRCAAIMHPDHRHFCFSLAQAVKDLFNIDLAVGDLMAADIPLFLRPRIVFDDNRPQAIQAVGRWRSAVLAWEKKSIKCWDFGDIPETLILGDDPVGFPLIRYPALKESESSIDLITAATEAEAKRIHTSGVSAFVRQELEQELAWLRKNTSIDAHDRLSIGALGEVTRIFQKARSTVIEKFATPADPLCRSQQQFNEHISQAKKELAPALRRLISDLAQSGTLCATIAGKLAAVKKSSLAARNLPAVQSLLHELHSYMAVIVSDEADFDYLSNLLRYLKRLTIAMQRALNDPARYLQRMNEIHAYDDKLRLARHKPLGLKRCCRKLLEEYKISLFAQQEVKALPGTSEKKMKEMFEKIQ
jgi:ATP-dependent helicase HrpA